MANSTMDRLIRFRCKCGKKLKAPEGIIGKKVKCTRCPRVHRVPETDRLGAKKTRQKARAKVKPLTEIEAVADRPSLLSSPPLVSSPAKTIGAAPQPKITSSIAKPPVVIESGASEPSLMPQESDGSDSRFKLDPLQAPEPSDDLIGPSDSSHKFDFDLESINIETDLPSSSDVAEDVAAPAQLKKKSKKANAQSLPKKANGLKPLAAMLIQNRVPLIASGAIAGMIALVVAGYLVFFSGHGYPQEFSERPEVQNYIATMQKFREKKIKFSLMTEAYIKAKTPAESEVNEINAYKGEIEPLDNQDETLEAALEFFEAFQPEKARETLISATQNLSDKIPELEAKAKDYSSKLR